jgi:hypothetical protein
MILFGVSNEFSDIHECIHLQGKSIAQIVLNVPEKTRERTKSHRKRLQEFNEHPRIVRLGNFVPQENEECFVVPTTPQKNVLVEYLAKTFQLQLSHLIHPIAYVSPFVTIGQGVFIGARSAIGPDVF